MFNDPFQYCDEETKQKILKENATFIGVCSLVYPVVLILAVVAAIVMGWV